MTEADRAWLAGFLDGEGHITLRRNTKTTVVPEVIVATTCQATCDHLVSLLEALDAKPSYQLAKVKNVERHRPAWRVQVRGFRRVPKVAHAVRDLSVTKRPQWDLVLKYVESRNGSAYMAATPEQYALVEQIKQHNRTGPNRVTVR